MTKPRRTESAHRAKDITDPKMILERWGKDGLVVEIGTDGKVRKLHGMDRSKAARRWENELQWTSSGERGHFRALSTE